VENSLQEIAGSFTFAGMTRKLFASLATALLIGAVLFPLESNATEVCEGAECSVTFNYTGSPQSWMVPQDASNIRFEVYGAQGARGGRGGAVFGKLNNLPTQLLVLVGGAGSQAAYAPGGYNGGGNAGGWRGNEGSGGGASDIRSSEALTSRIVVAGGAGGGGGLAGAAGAHGGGLTSHPGGNGQGTGGGAGNQFSGGAAGVSNGGTAPTAGSLGFGGNGGSAFIAGGGGGGGGYYGGGGGGADENDCCSDGGGGGGGSSYTDPSYASNVSHLIGNRIGNGLVKLLYTKVPTIQRSSLVQSGQSLAMELEFVAEISGLESSDFELPAGCVFEDFVISSNLLTATVIGCAEGDISITLPALTVGSDNTGPLSDLLLSTEMDLTGPEPQWLAPDSPTNSAELFFGLDLRDAVSPPSTEEIVVTGCNWEFQELPQFGLLLTECQEGLVSVELTAMSLEDQFGNLGPTENLRSELELDLTAPEASFEESEISGTGPFTYSVLLVLSEEAELDVNRVSFSEGCPLQVTPAPLGYLLEASCGHGEFVWIVQANSLQDKVGWTGPAQELRLQVSNVAIADPVPDPGPVTDPVVESPSQDPVVVPPQEPANPEPGPQQPEPEVVQDDTPGPVEAPLDQTVPDSEPADPMPNPVRPVISPDLVLVITPAERIEVESAILVEPEVDPAETPPSEGQDTQEATEGTDYRYDQVLLGPTEGTPEEPSRLPWLLGVGALAAALLGFGIYRVSGR
jgi:hypothetical protein